MSPCEMERASLVIKKTCCVQSQSQDFPPAEEVAAVVTACRQAVLYYSLGYVRMYKNKTILKSKTNTTFPLKHLHFVYLILTIRSDPFEVFLALDPTQIL